MKLRLKSLVVAGAAAVLLAGAIWGFIEGRRELALERERERPVKAPLRVIAERGERVVVLSGKTRELAGIGVAVPDDGARQAQLQAFGTVLSVQGLTDLKNTEATARAQVEKARAALSATRQEYRRLKILNGEDHAISDKALQAAEAGWRSDEATAHAAEQALRAVEQGARQQFGPTLMRAVVDGTPLFRRLSQQQAVLVQVTLPAATRLTAAPGTSRLQLPDGTVAMATLISPAPQTDPRWQGQSFFYLANDVALLPGMTLSAMLASGPQAQGRIVPAAAVVWWQGRAWAYSQQAPERFKRLALPTDNPIDEGWFVGTDFADGKPLVIRGAQLLLSEELRAQIQVGEDSENR